MEAPSNTGSRKSAWTAEEDSILSQYIDMYGEGKWHQVPLRTGLSRCRKSCRLRWLNYLNPNIKKGRFSSDEVDLLLRLHKLLGNRWTLIAGRIPGRTANDVKNYWNTHLSKKKDLSCKNKMGERNPKSSVSTTAQSMKPQPQSFSNNGCSHCNGLPEVDIRGITNIDDNITCSSNTFYGDVNTFTKDKEKYRLVNNVSNEESNWWESLLEESGEVDVLIPAATAFDEAGTSLMNTTSSTFNFEQLWSLFNEETGRLD